MSASDSTTPAGPTRPLNYSRKADRLLRRDVFVRDDFTCQMCGHRPAAVPDSWGGETRYYDAAVDDFVEWPFLLEICPDHVVPKSKGGPNTIENLQTSCAPCNCKKGASI